MSYWQYADMFRDGWRFKATRMGDDTNIKSLRQQLNNGDILYIGTIRASDKHAHFSQGALKTTRSDDVLIYFAKSNDEKTD